MFPTWDGVKETLLKSRVCSLTLVGAVSVKSRLTGEAGKRRGGAEVGGRANAAHASFYRRGSKKA